MKFGRKPRSNMLNMTNIHNKECKWEQNLHSTSSNNIHDENGKLWCHLHVFVLAFCSKGHFFRRKLPFKNKTEENFKCKFFTSQHKNILH